MSDVLVLVALLVGMITGGCAGALAGVYLSWREFQHMEDERHEVARELSAQLAQQKQSRDKSGWLTWAVPYSQEDTSQWQA